MVAAIPPLPEQSAALVDDNKRPTDPFFRWLRAQDKDSRVVIDQSFASVTHSVGSTNRTLEDVWRDLPSILDFGFVTGGADNAAVFVAMLTYCAANGIGAVWAPKGDYWFNTYPNQTCTVSILGAGRGITRFINNFNPSGTDNGPFQLGSGVTLCDLTVHADAGKTAGGSNVVIKGGASRVCLRDVDLTTGASGKVDCLLRVNNATYVSVSGVSADGAITNSVSLVSLVAADLSFRQTNGMALSSCSQVLIDAGGITGNLSIDSGSSGCRVRAGTLSGTLTNSSTTCNVEEGLTGSRRGNSTDGVQFLPNRRVRKWMTNAVNTSFIGFAWATNLGGNDVPFTAVPDIVGIYNSGASTAGAGWQNVTTTTVEIRGSASNGVRIVAEGPY